MENTETVFDDLKKAQFEKMMEVLDVALVQIEEKNERFEKARFDLYQRQILEQMFKNYINNKHTILVAPTGSGKSLISLLYTYVVSKMNGDQPCTIMATDTFLQNQYIESNEFFTSHVQGCSFAMLKGKGQYECIQTHTPYPQGVCGKRKISPAKAYETKECASQCTYVQSYMASMSSNIRVFNYHLFLSYANWVGSHAFLEGNPTVVLDECHKVDDILDGFANTEIGANFIKNIPAMKNTLDVMKPELVPEFEIVANKTKEAYKTLMRSVILGGSTTEMKNNYEDMCRAIMEFSKIGIKVEEVEDAEESEEPKTADEYFSVEELEQAVEEEAEEVKDSLVMFVNKTKETYQKLADAGSELPPMIQTIFSFSDFMIKGYFLLQDIKDITPEKFVINYNKETKSITVANISTSDRFRTLIKDHLFCPIVLMSATVGNADYFAEYLGIEAKDVDIINVASMFDFSKSPIIPIFPLISMSNSNLENNLETMMVRIDNILNVHSQDNGIIHTANKKIATYIMQNSDNKSRLLTYTNAQEKKEVIEKLESGTNYVIVAYSMEEGVDFKDDLGRFQIIAKLSWAYLGDYIVKRKMDVYPKWYEMTTLNKLLQTFGRINRHINDYGITYILDSSFGRLLDNMDDITRSRVKNLFYDQITEEMVKETFKRP